jgi:hypothetical protein
MIPIILLSHEAHFRSILMLLDQHLRPVIVLNELDDLGLQLLFNARLLSLQRPEFQAYDRVRLLKFHAFRSQLIKLL